MPFDHGLLTAKRRYIEIKSKITELDRYLSHILAIRTAIAIYSVMLNIYILSITNGVPSMTIFSKLFVFNSIHSVVELIISSFICGSVHQKSEELSEVLDRIDSNSLSESEYKEWLMFSNVCRKSSFGFTIGGFAYLRKSTLIPVRIYYLKY